jgi:hypothetical protein
MLRRLPVLILLLSLTGCAVGVAPAGEAETTLATPTSTVARTSSPPSTLPASTPSSEATSSTTTTSEPADVPELSTQTLEAHETLSARSDHPLDVYARPVPVAPFTTLEATTILGTPRVVRVIEGPIDGWLRVALPIRPNGTEGWVQADGLTLFKVDRRVEIDLSDRTLVVVDADGVLLETSVAVGSATSPTPTGSFFITDSVITGNEYGPWGPWAFGLSARSDVITEFNGGDGIIGIHGTNRPSSIGSAASLGCVRVPNDIALELGGILSAGVPVEIRP